MSIAILPTPVPSPAPSPITPLMTAEEFAQRHAGDHVELVKGVVKELSMPGGRHGKICFLIARAIGNVVMDRDLGHVLTNDSFVLLRKNPDTIRGTDVMYYSYERLPKGLVPEGVMIEIPDLVVEVRSPSDTWTEIFAKVTDYLVGGVRVVVVLDADSVTASVYRPNMVQQTFGELDELVISDVLPGFAVKVAQLFA